MDALLGVRLDSPVFLAVIDVVAGVVALTVLALLLASRRRTHRVAAVGAAVGGGVLGWCVAWFVSDVADLFGVALSTPIRLWTAALFGGVALGVTGLAVLRGRLRVVAMLVLPLCLLASGAGINADIGQFPTVRSALGIAGYRPIASAAAGAGAGHGAVGSVTIPAPVSGFHARKAMVYLPPVLRTAHPPELPVIEALSGQPGSPQDLFTAGHLAAALDTWAAAHDGVAPIVVVPDQLGSPEKNPMCVDSPLGNSATYLTVDVPGWIRSHYRVSRAASGWAIAGFSQGGTCSIQLGAAHPELYGAVLDISGELQPRAGSPARTVQTGFGGSVDAYQAAAPAAILAREGPHDPLHVIFVAGSNDARYLGWARTLADAARNAGADTRLIVSPGTGHDWHTVRYAMTHGLPLLMQDIGAR